MKVLGNGAGVGCIWLGIWLMVTAVLLFYAETAPTVAAPDFRWVALTLVGGGSLFGIGCIGRRRAKRKTQG